MGNHVPITSVEARHEATHIHYFHDRVNFHQPRMDAGVNHKAEDSWQDWDALGDAVLGFEDGPGVPDRLTNQLTLLLEDDDQLQDLGTHNQRHIN